jgi:serine/threonine protein kinase
VDYNDPAYITLEFVPWPTLNRYRRHVGSLAPVHVAKIGIKILQGLRCMERRRMVHRDLKPDNLCPSSEGH